MVVVPVSVEFQTGDGVTLRGLRWGAGSDWLLFVHDCDGESDLDSWRPLIPDLLNGEWTLLAIDLRGHGASDGEWTIESAGCDLVDSIRFAKSQGAIWIAVLASGRAAVAALETVQDIPIDALVLLSPLIEGESPDNLRGRGEAKLFAVGGMDLALRNTASRLRNQSIGWAMLITMPTEAQGAALLTGDLAGQVRERIVTFLKEQCVIARTRGIAAAR